MRKWFSQRWIAAAAALIVAVGIIGVPVRAEENEAPPLSMEESVPDGVSSPEEEESAPEAEPPTLPDGETSPEPAPDEEIGLFRAARLAEEEPQISIKPEYTSVYAQGVPIVLKKSGEITSVYDTKGKLLSEDTDVSNYLIFGGWLGEEHNENTSVTLESGHCQMVFGGSCYGTLNGTASIIIKGGSAGFVFGGGQGGHVTNTHVQVLGTPDSSTAIYAGGYTAYGYVATVDKVLLELHGVSGSIDTGTPGAWQSAFTNLSGGGWEDTVEEAQIIIGGDCDLDGCTIYAGSNPDASSTVNQSSVEINIKMNGVSPSPKIQELNGTGVSGKTSVRFVGDGTVNQDYAIGLNRINEVSVNRCSFVFGGDVKLDRLEIDESAEAVFYTAPNSIEIGELAGSGTICFAGSSITPITVNQISASPQAPLKLNYKFDVTEALWESAALLQGSGVEALDSADCFVVTTNKSYIAVKENNQIKVEEGDGRTQAYIQPPTFDKPSYQYGDTMTIRTALYAGGTPVPNAPIEIRAGDNGLFTVASGVTDAEGNLTLSVPIDDALWNNRKTGLQAIFRGNETYKENVYGISLVDSGGDMHFDLTKAAEIALPGGITPPAVGATPVRSLPVEDSRFYTAEVVWEPGNAAFLYNTEYTASIRLIPKKGYSLNLDRISSVTYNGTPLALPETVEPDGSLLLKDVASFQAIQGYAVTVSASPAEGGTVTGEGVYPANEQVTVTATPAEGWRFLEWREDGNRVSDSAGYAFSLTRGRVLTAVFEKIPVEPDPPAEQEQRVNTSALTEVPGELKKLFSTVDEILMELRTKVTAALSGASENIAYYDVRLQYLDENGKWQDVDPQNFPEEGITALLPYPDGTDGDGYRFTVQHMISYGEQAGQIETLDYTVRESGLECSFRSLSPVAIGWEKKEPEQKPAAVHRGGGSVFFDKDEETEFWWGVQRAIENAQPGNTVNVNLQAWDRLPWSVMEALKKHPGVTLKLRREDGTEIIVSQPLDMSPGTWYPVAFLERSSDETPASPDLEVNPYTGGVDGPRPAKQEEWMLIKILTAIGGALLLLRVRRNVPTQDFNT